MQFARTHVGHFRVMFQRAVQNTADADAATAPIEEAAQTRATLEQFADAAHGAGYGRGLTREQVAHVAWATVHGLAVLRIEGSLDAQPRRRKKRSDDALVRGVVGALRRLLDRA